MPFLLSSEEFTEGLAKGGTGKVLKKVLREKCRSGRGRHVR